eukprot:scaffold274989_cov18-Tisochrysis_lutea.AAC.1
MLRPACAPPILCPVVCCGIPPSLAHHWACLAFGDACIQDVLGVPLRALHLEAHGTSEGILDAVWDYKVSYTAAAPIPARILHHRFSSESAFHESMHMSDPGSPA